MSKYDDLLAGRSRYDDVLNADQSRLRVSVRGAEGVNPDDAARTQSLAAQSGLPPAVVERNRETVENRAALSRYGRLLQTNPTLSEFLSSTENAQVAADDVASLQGLEWATKAFRAAHAEQWKTIELSTLRAQQLSRDLTPEETARVTQIKSEISGSDFGAENWFEKIIVETGRLLPTMEKMTSESVTTGAATGLGFAGAAAAAGQAGPQVLTPEEVITVPVAGAMGMRVGAAVGGAKAAYNLEAGLALDEFLDMRGENGEPIDLQVARNSAALVGTVNAALELAGLSTVARFVPGLKRLVASPGRKAVSEALKRASFREAAGRLATGYAVGVGAEVSTEVMQEATTILGGEIAKSLSPGDFQGTTAEAVGARLAEVALKTTQGMALLGAVGPGAQFVSDAARAQQARRNQAVFEALGQHSTDSKLRQRLPARFQQYVAKLREAGDIDAIRIPVEEFATYFQTQRLDPAEVAREVTGSDVAYTEAQAAGTDLVIPLEAYATRLAPTEHHAALMPNLRLRPDDMTQREAEAWQKQSEELTAELVGADLNAPRQISQAVYDDVRGQLLGAGYEQGAAEQNATLMASVFETLGQRSNVDPMELYQRYGLSIERETPDVLRNITKFDTDLDPIIDRLRAGNVPTDREVYGPSITEFLREKGGLQDQGGELSARDVQKSFRGLVKPNGMTFDHASEVAREAGYLTERSDDALLEAIDRDLSGQGAFRASALDQQLLDLRTVLDDLDSYLAQQGIDLAQTDNAAVRQLLQSTQTLEQSKAPSNQIDMFASVQADKPAETAKPAAATEPEPAAATEEPAAEAAPEEDGTTDDVGEELWYNRRNQNRKGVTWGDVEGLNATLRSKEVQKGKIWPRPNYEQLVEDGLHPVAAHLIKQVYDSIASKPDTRGVPTDEQMKAYLEGVSKLRDATFALARSIDMGEFGRKLGDLVQASRGGGYGTGFKERGALGKVLGVDSDGHGPSRYPLVDTLFPLADGVDARYRFRVENENGKTNNALALLMGGNKLARAIKLDGESAMDAAKAVATTGWPAPQEAWQKRFDIRETPAGERVYDKGKDRVLEKAEFFIVKKGKRQILASGFDTREAAVEHAREMTKREGGTGTKDEALKVMELEREGVPRRDGDATSEKLMETFGFRGINFGNWMKGSGNEAERQAHLNHAYDSFADLAALLNVPPLAMSLNGMLGIAFGAQGSGGGAAAHFVPGVNEINLTRATGAGSLAHEWGHALDHYFNNQISEAAAKRTDPFLTVSANLPGAAGGGLRAEILESFRAIVKTMRDRDETPEEVAARAKASLDRAKVSTGKWLAHFRAMLGDNAEALAKFDALAARVMTGDTGEYANAQKKVSARNLDFTKEREAEIRDLIKKATGKAPDKDDMRGLSSNAASLRYSLEHEAAGDHKPMTAPTAYRTAAGKLDAEKGGKDGYWSSPWEMFARAFESYVMDTLEARAIKNDYLVSSMKAPHVQEAMVKLGLKAAIPYPTGDERLAINASFDKLVGNLQHESTEKGVRLLQSIGDDKRGSITFGPSRKFSINLFKARDLSTFLHESGHFYLEVLGDLAEASDAPEQIVQDYAALLKWMGVETRQAIKVEHHEQFARGFEAYLYEGKAPNVELQNAFARFRAWLVSIYRKLSALDVDLTKEVRGVFDRLVATDDAIAGAEEAQNYVAIFADAEAAGMTPEEFAAYRKTVADARLQAEDDLSRKLLAVTTREQKAWWKERRAEVLAKVAAEVHGQRQYRALSFLRYGTSPDGTALEGVTPVKIDKAALIKEFGYPQNFLNRLPGAGKSKVYATEGGVHPDIVAAMFGYRGTADMVTELINARPMKELIAAETDARMRELYPDPLVDGSLAEEAIQSVHSGKRAELLAAELRALNRKRREVSAFVQAAERAKARQQGQAREANRAQRPDRDELKLIRAAAERAVAGKRVRDVQPATYRVAEARAARAAFAAAEKGDFEVAYFEKRKQLLNHELFAAAEAALEETEAARDYFKRFGKKALRERIGKAQDGAIEKIDALLAEVDLVRLTNKAVDTRTVLAGVLEQIDNGDIVADEATIAMLRGQQRRNWRELTVEALAGLRDVIKQLEHEALETSEALVNGEKVRIDEAANAVAGSIVAGNKAVMVSLGEPSGGERAARGGREAVATWLRSSAIARLLDGGKNFGAVTQNIIVPIRRAYAEKLIPMQLKAQEDVAALYQAFYSNEELGRFRKRQPFAALNAELSKSDVLSLALNWGNEENRKAVLDGIRSSGEPAYTAEGVAQALATLDERDWKFVQAVWDYLDSYWPALSATTKRRRGITPRKVEATAFTARTADGKTISVSGGYYPLKYDGRHSSKAKRNEIDDYFAKVTNGSFSSAQTRAGATRERVGSAKQVVRLGLSTIDQHLREITRDIAIGDEINFVRKLLDHKSVKSASANTKNDEALSALNIWLKDSAVGELPADGALEWGLAWIRTGFTKAKLAWNVTTTVLQITGLPQTFAVVGRKAFASGVGKYAANPAAQHKAIMGMSKFMQARYETNSWNKDVADTRAFLQSFFGVPTKMSRALDAISATYFWPLARVQMVVDEITWLSGYAKAVDEEGITNHDKAVLYADVIVEKAQTSGFFSDRSGIERGSIGFRDTRQSQFVRIWTTLISYMLAKGGLAYEETTAFRKKPTMVGAAKLATYFVMLYTIEAALAAVIRGQWPDDDDDEPWAWWLAKQSAASVVSGVPFIREVPAAKYGSGNTPLGGLAKDLFDVGVQASQGEVDDTLIKELNNVGGTVFHYPSGQLNRAVDAMWADGEGEDVSFYEYLTGPRND